MHAQPIQSPPLAENPWQWFTDARFGMFIHFGPYSVFGRGEQVLMREWMDQRAYAQAACTWNPGAADPDHWCKVAQETGMKYVVLTARHHDGYCLWRTSTTDYSCFDQAPHRDLVGEFVDSARRHGLRVGLYYSWADFRIPAFFEGPTTNPDGWATFISYVHRQVLELMTNYGKIDVLWFDGEWPHSPETWRSPELVAEVRRRQPGILINNRLGIRSARPHVNGEGLGAATDLGDFGTPEHHITAGAHRLWESCQVSTWRLWGWAAGEHWRPASLLADMLVEAAGKGGNLLLNVGPRPDGQLPPEFVERAHELGDWMRVNGEAIYGSEPGEIIDFTTHGRTTHRGNNLYLIVRFWDGSGVIRFPGLATRVRRAVLLATGQRLDVTQDDEFTTLRQLPAQAPGGLFPVIRLECDSPPQSTFIGKTPQWTGDPLRYAAWARARGNSVFADGLDP